MKTVKILPDVRICLPVNPDSDNGKYFTYALQQKFDFHRAMCYNFKAKSTSQRLIKFDLRAQEPDEVMGGLSDIKRRRKT